MPLSFSYINFRVNFQFTTSAYFLYELKSDSLTIALWIKLGNFVVDFAFKT